MKTRIRKDRKKDLEMQRQIKARANYSLAILGMAFVWRGSGRFISFRADSSHKKEE